MLYVTISVFALIIGIAIWSHNQALRRRTARLNAIDEQFKLLCHDDETESTLSFDGRDVTVVHDFVDPPLNQYKRALQEPPTLHRVFRNAHGHYFLFISGEPPFIDHISRDRAMNALRGDSAAFEREFGATATDSL